MFNRMNIDWSFIEVSAFTTFLAGLVLIFYNFYKSQGIPPGPWGLPYIGYWPFLTNEDLHVQLEKMMKKYGKVFSFTVTGSLYIHLGSNKAVKEAHIKNSDCFRTRSSVFTPMTFVFKKAVVAQSGEPWKVLRKFSSTLFKNWAANIVDNCMSDPVSDTMERITDNLRSNSGKVVDIVDLVTDEFAEMFHRLLFGNEKLDSEQIRAITNVFKILQARMIENTSLLAGNFARYIILPLIPEHHTFMKNCEYAVTVYRKEIKRHIETFDPNSIRNVIDSFLKERQDRYEKDDPNAKYFTDDALAYVLFQYTGDTVLDMAFFPAFLIKALLIYPEEQEKIYSELMEVVSSNRQPSLEDKNQLSYTNAFIWEVLRLYEFTVLFPSLECTRDTVVSGYKIPKGSITLVNMWAASHDDQEYEDPQKFNPTRFLSKPGKVKESLPIGFGVGKRACTGESLSIILSFIFITKIVYNFKVSTPDKAAIDSSLRRRELNVCFEERKHD